MKILVAGDLCPGHRVNCLIKRKQYDLSFSQVKQLVDEYDFAMVNLECPIVERDSKAIIKVGDNLKTSSQVIDLIQYLGFNCVSLANNHFYDYGDIGVSDTLRLLDRRGIMHVGGGRCLGEAEQILYKSFSDGLLAVINVCEQEFSIATNDTAGSAPLNPIKQFYKIQEAKRKGAYVLVVVHGGHEHFNLPSPRMVDLYRFFIDVGADAVVNHHQHCYSGYEVYHGKTIFYGLGNFCFDIPQKNYRIPWNYGYLVGLDFGKTQKFDIFPYEQCGENCEITLQTKDESFNQRIESLNSIIKNRELLNDAIDKYYKQSHELCKNILNPMPTKFLRFLQRYKLLPNLLRKTWKLRLYNYIVCESHRDKLIHFLKKGI